MRRYIADDIVLEINSAKCIGCSYCADVCPQRCIDMKTDISGKRFAYVKEKALCIECGACKSNCVVGAVTANGGVGCAQALISSYFDEFKKILGIK